MYTYGLDISEKAIHGSVVEDGEGRTVKYFCIPRSLASLRAELQEFQADTGLQPGRVRVCASDHARDLLVPLWQDGYKGVIAAPESSAVDRLLLRAYRLQLAHWDRAHLVAWLALEQSYDAHQRSPREFCLQWAWLRTREKVRQLQHLRNRVRRPSWLCEPMRYTISTAATLP